MVTCLQIQVHHKVGQSHCPSQLSGCSQFLLCSAASAPITLTADLPLRFPPVPLTSNRSVIGKHAGLALSSLISGQPHSAHRISWVWALLLATKHTLLHGQSTARAGDSKSAWVPQCIPSLQMEVTGRSGQRGQNFLSAHPCPLGLASTVLSEDWLLLLLPALGGLQWHWSLPGHRLQSQTQELASLLCWHLAPHLCLHLMS